MQPGDRYGVRIGTPARARLRSVRVFVARFWFPLVVVLQVIDAVIHDGPGRAVVLGEGVALVGLYLLAVALLDRR